MSLRETIEKIANTIKGKTEEQKKKEYEKPTVNIGTSREIQDTPEICVSWDPSEEELVNLKDRIENTADEASKRWQQAAEKAKFSMKEAAEAVNKISVSAGEMAKVFSREVNFTLGNIDKWQYEKMKMPNNERKRKKMPMIRRRAGLNAERNSRRSSKG